MENLLVLFSIRSFRMSLRLGSSFGIVNSRSESFDLLDLYRKQGLLTEKDLTCRVVELLNN